MATLESIYGIRPDIWNKISKIYRTSDNETLSSKPIQELATTIEKTDSVSKDENFTITNTSDSKTNAISNNSSVSDPPQSPSSSPPTSTLTTRRNRSSFSRDCNISLSVPHFFILAFTGGVGLGAILGAIMVLIFKRNKR
jgi:hypothetical protein